MLSTLKHRKKSLSTNLGTPPTRGVENSKGFLMRYNQLQWPKLKSQGSVLNYYILGFKQLVKALLREAKGGGGGGVSVSSLAFRALRRRVHVHIYSLLLYFALIFVRGFRHFI